MARGINELVKFKKRGGEQVFNIFDGRTAFYQWDKDRKLIVNDPSIAKVHFCNRTGSCSLVRCVYEVNGVYLVDVPNIILQESYRINVYGYDANYTKHSDSFNIVPRSKPEDYIYTEAEVAQWETLEERINQIEENGVSDETIAAAINGYLEENPIEAGATEEQAAQIESNKQNIAAIQSNYATTTYVGKTVEATLGEYATKTYVGAEIAKAQLGGGDVDLSNYYTKEEVDNIVDAIEISNDGMTEGEVRAVIESYGYLTDHQDLSAYATQSWVEGKNYLTQHQSLAEYAKKSEIPDVSGYQTADQVNAAINTAIAAITDGEEVSY